MWLCPDFISQVQELQVQLDQTKRSVTELKRQCRRLTSDLQDARVLTDSLQGRAHELERKQRRSVSLTHRAFMLNIHDTCACVSRFDSELTQALEQADNEREQKDRVIQENTALGAEIFTLRKTLKVKPEVKGPAFTICDVSVLYWCPLWVN